MCAEKVDSDNWSLNKFSRCFRYMCKFFEKAEVGWVMRERRSLRNIKFYHLWEINVPAIVPCNFYGELIESPQEEGWKESDHVWEGMRKTEAAPISYPILPA